jgi:hypothetical protein
VCLVRVCLWCVCVCVCLAQCCASVLSECVLCECVCVVFGLHERSAVSKPETLNPKPLGHERGAVFALHVRQHGLERVPQQTVFTEIKKTN